MAAEVNKNPKEATEEIRDIAALFKIEESYGERLLILFQLAYESWLYTVYMILVPITFPLSFFKYSKDQLKKISHMVSEDGKRMWKFNKGYYDIVRHIWSASIQVLFYDANTTHLMERISSVFREMAEVLQHYRCLPLSKNKAILYHLILGKLPAGTWGSIVPYPHPFFKNSITMAVKDRQLDSIVTYMEEVPIDFYKPLRPARAVDEPLIR